MLSGLEDVQALLLWSAGILVLMSMLRKLILHCNQLITSIDFLFNLEESYFDANLTNNNTRYERF